MSSNINGTNNKVIYLNMKSMLESEDRSTVFDAMQSEANEMNKVDSCDSELQKGYMKLLSNNSKNK